MYYVCNYVQHVWRWYICVVATKQCLLSLRTDTGYFAIPPFLPAVSHAEPLKTTWEWANEPAKLARLGCGRGKGVGEPGGSPSTKEPPPTPKPTHGPHPSAYHPLPPQKNVPHVSDPGDPALGREPKYRKLRTWTCEIHVACRSLDGVSAPRYEMAGRDPLPSIPWITRSGQSITLKNVPPDPRPCAAFALDPILNPVLELPCLDLLSTPK